MSVFFSLQENYLLGGNGKYKIPLICIEKMESEMMERVNEIGKPESGSAYLISTVLPFMDILLPVSRCVYWRNHT